MDFNHGGTLSVFGNLSSGAVALILYLAPVVFEFPFAALKGLSVFIKCYNLSSKANKTAHMGKADLFVLLYITNLVSALSLIILIKAGYTARPLRNSVLFRGAVLAAGIVTVICSWLVIVSMYVWYARLLPSYPQTDVLSCLMLAGMVILRAALLNVIFYIP